MNNFALYFQGEDAIMETFWVKYNLNKFLFLWSHEYGSQIDKIYVKFMDRSVFTNNMALLSVAETCYINEQA